MSSCWPPFTELSHELEDDFDGFWLRIIGKMKCWLLQRRQQLLATCAHVCRWANSLVEQLFFELPFKGGPGSVCLNVCPTLVHTPGLQHKEDEHLVLCRSGARQAAVADDHPEDKGFGWMRNPFRTTVQKPWNDSIPL